MKEEELKKKSLSEETEQNKQKLTKLKNDILRLKKALPKLYNEIVKDQGTSNKRLGNEEYECAMEYKYHKLFKM